MTARDRKRRQRERDSQRHRNAMKRRRYEKSAPPDSSDPHASVEDRPSDDDRTTFRSLSSFNVPNLGYEMDCSSCCNDPDMEIVQKALVNITQFRDTPKGHDESSICVRKKILEKRDQIRRDIHSHEQAINPHCFTICRSCGHHVPRISCTSPRPATANRWLLVLEGKSFSGEGEVRSAHGELSDTVLFCQSCVNSLRRGKAPFGSICRGWPLNVIAPDVLTCLNKFELQLICLRLPCVYVWRAQGGFGQYACKGAAVSFANPVSDLADRLPRHPSKVFQAFTDRGNLIAIRGENIRSALIWLKHNNPLYKLVVIDEHAFEDIHEFQVHMDDESTSRDTGPLLNSDNSSAILGGGDPLNETRVESQDLDGHRCNHRDTTGNTSTIGTTSLEELSRGTQGPIDFDAVEQLAESTITGVEDMDNHYHAQLLIQHMLRPFKHRKNALIPSYDAALFLESYFPVLFPYGRGGVTSVNCHFATWVRHALAVYQSRFAADIGFIFFVHSVLKRKRLTGLSSHAPIRQTTSNAIVEVREMLDSSLPESVVAKRIDFLLRSGTLNASFETMRGSAAFWASLKRKSWAYLTRFGPCQIFVTISAADLIDPYLYCQIIPGLSLEDARNLSSKQRANFLASNPVSASCVFHRRIQSVFDNFFFGETKPFGNILAFLGRIEQQARLSPHLHLLLWLDRTLPEVSVKDGLAEAIAAFIETFCTALVPGSSLTDPTDVPCPKQKWPPKTYSTLSHATSFNSLTLNSNERYEYLSRPINQHVFDGCSANNEELRGQIVARQAHKCNSYCRGVNASCRFYFPFPPNPRGVLLSRNHAPNDLRCIALAPRRDPYLNSTHPMLTAMCHSNTDVTIVTGSSIPESMYVCSYAVKADKTPMFNVDALHKLKRIGNGYDDRKLLGVIARNSTSLKVIGAQEAVDYLLDRPLVFSSVEVRNIYTSFLLQHPSALTPERSQQHSQVSKRANPNAEFADILEKLDADHHAAVTSKTSYTSFTQNKTAGCGEFFKQYMDRPVSLEELSASQFHERFVVRRLRKGTVNYDESMVFSTRSHNDPVGDEHRHGGMKFIAVPRTHPSNRPHVTHILNVVSRGPADEECPQFAAAALALHIPFRSVQGLLGNSCLTSRLQLLLKDAAYPALNHSVSNCHDLSSALLSKPSNCDKTGKPRSDDASNAVATNGVADDDSLILEDEEIDANPLAGLPPLIACQGRYDPLSCSSQWNPPAVSDMGSSLQLERFREYVKDCKCLGISSADARQRSAIDSNCATDDSDEGAGDDSFQNELKNQQDDHDCLLNNGHGSHCPNCDFVELMHIKEKVLLSARNQDQRLWLDSVLSYLIVYYGLTPGTLPPSLLSELKMNHPIFTNAPGGCGKSWLLTQIRLFVTRCIAPARIPIWSQDNLESTAIRDYHRDEFDTYNVAPRDVEGHGRLGRVAVFAPSGVAAGNADGFTFHNGLRVHNISRHQIEQGPNEDALAKLTQDFSQVSVIVVEEYSMVSLNLLMYLDLVSRRVRPAFSDVPFGGIPTIITGDGFQLPVVSGCGILSDPSTVPLPLQSVHHHCNYGMFCLELHQSVRQRDDLAYGEILMRMRSSKSTQQDVDSLNTRLFYDLAKLCEDSSEWYYAPILTARNKSVDALNSAAIYRNGSKLGTFHIHNFPVVRRAKSVEARKKEIERFFTRPNLTSIDRSASEFRPPAILVLYPGMPVMLRTNICPGLVLFNGSIGTVVSINNPTKLSARETRTSVVTRCLMGVPAVPSCNAAAWHCNGRVQFTRPCKAC